MRKLVGLMIVLVILGLFAQESEARLSNNNRRAVVLEAFYALRPSHDGGCDKTIGGNCVSNWNYLANDYTAYRDAITQWHGCNSSIWTRSGDGSTCPNYNAWVSFYNNVWSYGYGTFGGSYGNVGRGGQCRYFANLLTRRSGSSTQWFSGYSAMWNYGYNVDQDLTHAVPGDVLTTNPAYSPHTAVVVEIKRYSNGQVYGLDLIDSNWISDTGGSNREIIGRHMISVSPQVRYGLWKGVSYYSEPYVP